MFYVEGEIVKMKKLLIVILFTFIFAILSVCQTTYYAKPETLSYSNPNKKENRKKVSNKMETMVGMPSEKLVDQMLLAKDEDAVAAIRVLGLRRDKKYKNELENYLSNTNNPDYIRAEAAIALARIGSDESRAVLEKTLDETNPDEEVLTAKKTTESIGRIGNIKSKNVIEIKMKKYKTRMNVVGLNALNRIDEYNHTQLWHKDSIITLPELPDYVIKNMEYQGNKKEAIFSFIPFYVLPSLEIPPLSNEILGELTGKFNKEGYKVITHDRIKDVMETQYMQSSDFYDDDYKTSLGQLVGASVILTGTITPYETLKEKLVRVRIEVISVETGLIVATVGVNLKWDNNIEKLLEVKNKDI